jgi:hypothetical protein
LIRDPTTGRCVTRKKKRPTPPQGPSPGLPRIVIENAF